MSESDLIALLRRGKAAPWRLQLARLAESRRIQFLTTAVIVFNAILLGLETSPRLMQAAGDALGLLDSLCLAYFIVEIGAKILAYRLHFFRNGWNVFDFAVVAVALVPDAGAWSVLRSLRVLRILRLLTTIPQLRKVVAAFMHAIPGLSGVIALMAIFYYTFGVLVTSLFGQAFPEWFGSLGRSCYTLFQIMTLESWSMGIVRPVMQAFPWAWAVFVPFIVVATFTILNLFIGIIVSTMQELSIDPNGRDAELASSLRRIESQLAQLQRELDKRDPPPSP